MARAVVIPVGGAAPIEEPLLRAEDRRLWVGWQRTFALHARSLAHRRAVDGAKRIVETTLRVAPRSCLMWSAGKDSTILLHLVRVGMGVDLPVFSEKDDLDFPGERAYVERLVEQWEADLTVLTPPLSPQAWLAEHAAELELGGDIHGRAAALSKTCFYEVVEKAGAPYEGLFLGLRRDESHGRRLDWLANVAEVNGRRVHGLYRRAAGGVPGQWRSCPLGAWTGMDVYAYAVTHGINLLPLYQAIAFMHARAPWTLRKSWWFPGTAARHGGIAWLAHYFPSLFERLRGWLPRAQGLR